MKDNTIEVIQDWTVSEEKPGYRVRILKHDKGTARIYSPIVSDEEADRINNQIMQEVADILGPYFYEKRKREAAKKLEEKTEESDG